MIVVVVVGALEVVAVLLRLFVRLWASLLFVGGMVVGVLELVDTVLVVIFIGTGGISLLLSACCG